MKEIKINAISSGTRLVLLGKQGENEALKIIFDVSGLIAEYGEGVAVVTYMRSKDSAPYVKVTERDGTNVTWNVDNTDTLFDGRGKANLMWNTNGTIVKTIDFDTYVFPSISGIVTVPDVLQSWYNEMLGYINSIAVDESTIEQVVTEYLEEHPIEAPVTSVNQKTGAVVLTSADVGALSQSELASAINTALEQAKASGEFDGSQGIQGEKGDKGEKGETGAQGIQGEKGDTGASGQDGADGQDLIHQGEEVTASGVVTKELSPNVFCLFSDTTTGISDLTITLASGEFFDEYMCAFTTSSSGCNLSLPDTVSYIGSAPTLEASTYYELSIVNNKAVIA